MGRPAYYSLLSEAIGRDRLVTGFLLLFRRRMRKRDLSDGRNNILYLISHHGVQLLVFFAS
jgi:hypothetical protein